MSAMGRKGFMLPNSPNVGLRCLVARKQPVHFRPFVDVSARHIFTQRPGWQAAEPGRAPMVQRQ